MAGAEKLLDKILGDARLQKDENLKKAKEEAAGIIASAREEAQKKKAEIMRRAEAESADLKKRMLAVSGLEARKKVLQAKQDMVEEAFKRALSKLNSMDNQTYENVIAGMIVSMVRTGNEEIILSEGDRRKLSHDFASKINNMLDVRGIKGNIRISDETRNFNGGFIMSSGDVEVNNSFESLLKMRRDELEEEVVKVLFK